MAKKTVYIPFYENGAYYWVGVTGDVNPKGCPEGEPAIKSSVATTVPPLRLQPHFQQEEDN